MHTKVNTHSTICVGTKPTERATYFRNIINYIFNLKLIIIIKHCP